MPDLTQFKTYDEAANAFKQSKQYRKLSDPGSQVDALHTLRDKFYEIHGVHKDLGPTDITPPDPVKRDGGKGDLSAPTGPLTEVPATTLGKPKTPDGASTEGPDFAGRVKAGAEGAVEASDKFRGATKSPIPDPIDLLVHALPGDNIQAGIDAAMALSMLTGAGEVEGAGGIAYKAMRALPAGARGVARLGARMVAPTVGGAIGGATEGKTASGAGRGALEQAGGEVLSIATRGLFGMANKAIQKTDLRGLGNWLSEKLPDFPGLRNIGDFRKLFLRGELEDAASEKLGKVETQIGRQLGSKGTAAPKATVFSPTAQDTEQEAALATERNKIGTKDDPYANPDGTTNWEKYLSRPDVAGKTETAPAKTVFTKKSEPTEAYQKVKDIQAELKAAQAKKGSGLSAENKAREDTLTEIRARLKQAQEDARAATKGAKAGGKQGPVDLKAAVEESQRRGVEAGAKPSTYQSPSMKKQVNPRLEIELPGPMADKLGLARRTKYPFEWRDLIIHLNETENKGWALIGNPDPEKAELGKALRSSVFQAEHDAADSLRNKGLDKLADDWLAQRQQYRAARVLTQMFRTPDLVDASGNIQWDEVQRLVDAAGREGYYDDLKLAFGKDGADAFVDKLHRGEPDVRDRPGRGILTTHSRVYMHPGLGKLSPRIPLQIPVPTVRAGDVPFNLGRNRALSAMLVLGPERFVQMIDDMTKMGGQTTPAGAVAN